MCFRCFETESARDPGGIRDAGAKGPRPFALPGTEPRYARDRVVKVKHILIDVALDFERRRVEGAVTTTVAALTDGVRALTLDAVEMTIESVSLDGGALLEWRHDGERLAIHLPSPLAAGAEARIRVAYTAAPRRGLYFIAPDAQYPQKQRQAWTQGQDEDSRYWFPCYDYPNEKATTEVKATVPGSMFALSNGKLVGVTDDAAKGTKTWHYALGTPHVAYLVTLVAGEFDALETEADGVPLQYYVPKGRKGDIERSFALTPAMIRRFEWVTGARYPYEKYAQICVGDFIFGGMENTSATTLTDLTLHDAKAHEDQSSDSLVAHELAHQWFGDLLTCKDWSHGWLNEGFATFFEALWKEEHAGWDEYRWYISLEAASYLDEDGGSYRRPIVTRVYKDPIEVFDRHLYEKGCCVLDMMRYVLSDELFWKSVRLYVARHRGGSVVTADLAKAVEDATGRNIEWFLDQWVFRGGHPDLEVSFDWDEDRKVAKVTVKQTQKEDEVTPLFRMPLHLGFHLPDGSMPMQRVELLPMREQSFLTALPQKPTALRFDPGDRILKTIQQKLSDEMLRTLLEKDPCPMLRARAARGLGEKASPKGVQALAQALRADKVWFVQAEAARALGAARGDAACDALTAALGTVTHVKARRAILEALGSFRVEPSFRPRPADAPPSAGERAAAALEKIVLGGDASYLVESEAARSLGKTRSPRAFGALTQAIERQSHADVLQQGCAGGLAELRDERGISVLKRFAIYGAPPSSRASAITALAKLGRAFPERRDEVRDTLEMLLDDPWFRAQVAVPGALGSLGEAAAIPAIERAAERALDGRVRRKAGEAVKKLERGRHREDEIKALREDVDRLKEENTRLKDRLEKLEPVGAGSGPGSPSTAPKS